MGTECPICGKHGAYIAAITATGEPAMKNKDIIARKLECGHVLGNQEYMQYREQLDAIERASYTKIEVIRADVKRQKTALWSAILASPVEV